MLKRILVPLDSSKFTSAAIRMAANIANREKTSEGTEVTLVGLGIVDTDQLPSGRFSSVVDRDQIIAEAEQGADELIAAFKEESGKPCIPTPLGGTKHPPGPPFTASPSPSHPPLSCPEWSMGSSLGQPPRS